MNATIWCDFLHKNCLKQKYEKYGIELEKVFEFINQSFLNVNSFVFFVAIDKKMHCVDLNLII